MAKNNKPASNYAAPHTMAGAEADINSYGKLKTDPSTVSGREVTAKTGVMRVSLGDPGADNVKSDGIKIRGTGAATKGVTARGPMG